MHYPEFLGLYFMGDFDAGLFVSYLFLGSSCTQELEELRLNDHSLTPYPFLINGLPSFREK